MFIRVSDLPVGAKIYNADTGIQAVVLGKRPVQHRVTAEPVQTWVNLKVYGYGNELGQRWYVNPYEAEYALRNDSFIEITGA